MVLTLKAARINAGLTQKEAAAALGITKGTLANYEMGKTVPKIDTAKKMVKLYGVSANHLDFF